jgi:putative membrane protein insertion efficiency factor
MAREVEQTDRPIMSLAARLLVAIVRLYQASLGPFMGGHCRFSPTCSQYAIDALTAHGAMRGSWLTVRRIGRCHPFGGGGYDPV